MHQIDTPEGKLLYLVYDMYRKQEIKAKDRHILKDMIISSNPVLLERYKQYAKDGTQMTLKNSMRKLCWQEKQRDMEFSSASSSSTKRKNIKIDIPVRMIQKISTRQ